MSEPQEGRGTPPPSERPRRRWWAQEWARAVTEVGSVSPQRRAQVLREIDEGSQPTAVYYVLLGLSELIAGFALIVNSDATLIGANVVAPLMTPIFGVSLGLMPFMGEPSAALLAQTKPTLIDLFVAALAGFAGVLAMIDERISPALPGVAIATALNPPIAAIGLCLARGAYVGAWGAFLLFFANVLAILAVAAVLFLIAGFVTRAEIGSFGGLARRFAAAAIGLALVTALLTNYLVSLVRNLRTETSINTVLDDALAQEPNTALVDVSFSRSAAGIDVLSTVRTPRVMAPEHVKRIQDALSERLGEPVRLYMRCSVTKDVSATGSPNLRPYLNLNGRVTEAPLTPSMRLLEQAEQVAREVAATRPGLSFTGVDLVQLPAGPVFVVSVESTRDPTPEDVGRFETLLRQRLDEPSARVVVRRTVSSDVTAKGHILLGEAHFGPASGPEAEQRRAAESAVRANVEKLPGLFATAVDAVRRDGTWRVRAEVVGPRVPTPAEVRGIEERSAAAVGEPLTLSVWARVELQVTDERYEPLGDSRGTADSVTVVPGGAPP